MLELHRHIDQVRDIAISIALSEMVLVALFSLVFGSFLTRQLLALTTGAERLSAGELGYQLEVKGSDELAQTAVAFNAMSHDLLADRHKRNAIMIASLDPIITTDKDGHILECNAATERVFGLAERELIKRSLVETLILEEHRTHYLNLLHGLAAPRDISLSAQRFEIRCQRGDGSPFTAELSVGSSEFDSEVYL
ncbi:PAS domain S-box protein [Candidatus Reidiella endopervernicosa]|uniref:PAS domain S-box protein n=1 Tax=Candidatus Reidiella endopervernicosa TaxID=2738883 RepID=A0A6N0HWC2_9GAMM|nr:PAS domain S-box protein [Candidatus Reidiella endopervernicosa]QKQ26685.1 PAS domain S-box protein [Candidatus Reidiella endopervernicosa]